MNTCSKFQTKKPSDLLPKGFFYLARFYQSFLNLILCYPENSVFNGRMFTDFVAVALRTLEISTVILHEPEFVRKKLHIISIWLNHFDSAGKGHILTVAIDRISDQKALTPRSVGRTEVNIFSGGIWNG